MRQRAMIALALACDPELLIADEPTTALDVTIQAQILALLRDLKASTGVAIILITHDLGVVAEICDHVAVMYAGEIVEYAPVDALFASPQHPYTIGLLGSIPRLDAKAEQLVAIKGMVPSTVELPAGCRFAPRCPFVRERCTQSAPPLADVGPDHRSRCIRAPLEEVVVERGPARSREPWPPIHCTPLSAGPPDCRGDGGGRGELFAASRQHLGAGRRIRLRQNHARTAGAPSDRSDCGTHPF
jgi:oligopeptide/dipeptide ABC transporter ATP-binding protein